MGKSIMLAEVHSDIHYTAAQEIISQARREDYEVQGFVGWRVPDSDEAMFLHKRGCKNFFYQRSPGDIVVFDSYSLKGSLVLVRDMTFKEELRRDLKLFRNGPRVKAQFM